MVALFIQEQNTTTLEGLSGYANGVTIRGMNSIYGSRSSEIKIQDLNLKDITVSAEVLVKFALN